MNNGATSLEVIDVPEENRKEPTAQTQRIAKRLTALRNQQGISQQQVCKALGLTQSMMSRYENGQRRIPAELLAGFAKTLDVSADELLGIKTTKKNQEMDQETKKLWKKFQQVTRLPEHDRRAVIRMVNSLSKAKAKS